MSQNSETMDDAAAVLEVAILDVKPGEGDAFEEAFAQAQEFIGAAPGYRRHQLRSCVEQGQRYLLLVWWDSLESHTEGFRGSSDYQRWKALLHHFYQPFPTVEHYLPLLEGTGRAGGAG
jgi:heme-degrading monooxygenase HmoA